MRPADLLERRQAALRHLLDHDPGHRPERLPVGGEHPDVEGGRHLLARREVAAQVLGERSRDELHRAPVELPLAQVAEHRQRPRAAQRGPRTHRGVAREVDVRAPDPARGCCPRCRRPRAGRRAGRPPRGRGSPGCWSFCSAPSRSPAVSASAKTDGAGGGEPVEHAGHAGQVGGLDQDHPQDRGADQAAEQEVLHGPSYPGARAIQGRWSTRSRSDPGAPRRSSAAASRSVRRRQRSRGAAMRRPGADRRPPRCPVSAGVGRSRCSPGPHGADPVRAGRRRSPRSGSARNSAGRKRSSPSGRPEATAPGRKVETCGAGSAPRKAKNHWGISRGRIGRHALQAHPDVVEPAAAAAEAPPEAVGRAARARRAQTPARGEAEMRRRARGRSRRSCRTRAPGRGRPAPSCVTQTSTPSPVMRPPRAWSRTHAGPGWCRPRAPRR